MSCLCFARLRVGRVPSNICNGKQLLYSVCDICENTNSISQCLIHEYNRNFEYFATCVAMLIGAGKKRKYTEMPSQICEN